MRGGIRTSTIAVMLSSTIRLVIELDPGSDPISGTLQPQPDGEPTRFAGWLQLTQALESIRQSRTGAARTDPGQAPNAR